MREQNPREIAVEVLGKRGAGEYIEDALERALTASPLRPKDRGLCQELVYGVARNQSALDWLIARKTGGRDQKPVLRNLLRVGLYQVFWTDRIPGHAAVNETVESAKRRGFGPQAGFVNAILRGYLREAEATRALLADLKRSEPWVAFSHPEWLVRRWVERWGSERTAAFLTWNNTPPDTFARVNTLKTDAGRLLEQWREEGVDYDFVRADWLEESLVFKLKEHPPLHRLNSFGQGLFYIQDPSTLFSVRELEVTPGSSVLDMCAAPGGKFTLIAQQMRGEGKLAGTDISGERMALLRENCARLGVENTAIGVQEMVAGQVFDRVLLDAPCSNTGVMRRRVDLRWRLKAEEIKRLASMQLDLLRQGAERLKTGGILVYSTCSVEPEENGNLVREFLATHPLMRLERERTLLPFEDQTDGAYAARLRRLG